MSEGQHDVRRVEPQMFLLPVVTAHGAANFPPLGSDCLVCLTVLQGTSCNKSSECVQLRIIIGDTHSPLGKGCCFMTNQSIEVQGILMWTTHHIMALMFAPWPTSCGKIGTLSEMNWEISGGRQLCEDGGIGRDLSAMCYGYESWLSTESLRWVLLSNQIHYSGDSIHEGAHYSD